MIGPYDVIFSLTYFSVPSPGRKGCDPIIGSANGPGGNLGGLLVRSLIAIKITQAKRNIVTLIFTLQLLSCFVRPIVCTLVYNWGITIILQTQECLNTRSDNAQKRVANYHKKTGLRYEHTKT